MSHPSRPVPPLPDPPTLFDERGDPDFRAVFGHLMQASTEVDVALTRLRLGTLDLVGPELRRLRRLRLLLAEVNAVTLDIEAHGVLLHPDRGRSLLHLGDLLARGVIEVRAAPLAGWSPDFTVFAPGSEPTHVLLGFHWFERPFPHRGPALASLHGARAAALVRARFEGLWRRSHDISPAISGILARARSRSDRDVPGAPATVDHDPHDGARIVGWHPLGSPAPAEPEPPVGEDRRARTGG